MRKLSYGLLLSLAAMPTLAADDCSLMKGCERKFCEIQSELTEAKASGGNAFKVAGLTRALENAKAECSNENLTSDLQQELQEAEQDLEEYEADLKEAQQDADAEKIAKYQGKIAEERSAIDALEQQLSELE